jgi:hypothetical protein
MAFTELNAQKSQYAFDVVRLSTYRKEEDSDKGLIGGFRRGGGLPTIRSFFWHPNKSFLVTKLGFHLAAR